MGRTFKSGDKGTTGSTNSVVANDLAAEFATFKAEQLAKNKEVKEDQMNLGDGFNMMVATDVSTIGGTPPTITTGGSAHIDFLGMIAKNTAAIIAALSNKGNTGRGTPNTSTTSLERMGILLFQVWSEPQAQFAGLPEGRK